MSARPSDSKTDPVRIERSGALATVVLDDPEARNALTPVAKPLLRDALRELADDDSVRAVVLTGTGRFFCMGQHLGSHAEGIGKHGPAVLDTVTEEYAPTIEAIYQAPKPVIAAVNGTAAGAGLALALACDLRVFAAGTTLITAFAGIGFTGDSGITATLVRSVGETRARRLLLLNEAFTPEQAVAWGVDGDVVPAEEVLTVATELGRRLAAGPTLAYAETKRLIASAAAGASISDIMAAEGAAQKRLGATADHKAAVQAFLEKRPAVFEGK